MLKRFFPNTKRFLDCVLLFCLAGFAFCVIKLFCNFPYYGTKIALNLSLLAQMPAYRILIGIILVLIIFSLWYEMFRSHK